MIGLSLLGASILFFTGCSKDRPITPESPISETPPPSPSSGISFSIGEPSNEAEVTHPTCFEGSDRTTPINGTYDGQIPGETQIWPVVKAPDNNYYPNPPVTLLAGNKWDGKTTFGYEGNQPKEVFYLEFWMATDAQTKDKITTVQKTEGRENFSALPQGVTVLPGVKVIMGARCS